MVILLWRWSSKTFGPNLTYEINDSAPGSSAPLDSSSKLSLKVRGQRGFAYKGLTSWNRVEQGWVETQSSAPLKPTTFHKVFNEYHADQGLVGQNLRAEGEEKNCSMGIQDDSVGKGSCCQARSPGHDGQNPRDERKACIPATCPLRCACMPWHTTRQVTVKTFQRKRNCSCTPMLMQTNWGRVGFKETRTNESGLPYGLKCIDL